MGSKLVLDTTAIAEVQGPPGVSATWRGKWASGTIYTAGPPPDGVLGSNGRWYVSLVNNNVGHDPTTDGGVNWADLSGLPFKRLVEDFGADPTGTLDSTAAVQAAANSGKPVFCAPGTYLCANVSLPGSANFFAFGGPASALQAGGTTFKKNANGPVFTVNGFYCRFFGCNIDGTGANFTGRGFNMGTGSDHFRWLWGDIVETESYCADFPNSDSGQRESFVDGLFYTHGLTLPAFHFPPADTQPTDRLLMGCYSSGSGGLADFNGCETVMVIGCDGQQVLFGAGSKKVTMTGCRIPSVGADTTIYGTNHTIVGNTHAGRFVIDSTASFCNVGPNTTVNPSVNNSATSTLIDPQSGTNVKNYGGGTGYRWLPSPAYGFAENIVTNPVFASATTGWATTGFGALNTGATLTRVTTGQLIDAGCGQVATTNALAAEGIATTLTGRLAVGVSYLATVWLKGNAGGEVIDFGVADATLGDSQQITVTLTTGWVKYSLVYIPTGSEHTAPYLFLRTDAAAAVTFFVDAVQVGLP